MTFRPLGGERTAQGMEARGATWGLLHQCGADVATSWVGDAESGEDRVRVQEKESG